MSGIKKPDPETEAARKEAIDVLEAEETVEEFKSAAGGDP
jgi:hypothetical protein